MERNIHKIADLRAVLETWPGDAEIYFQTVATDGTAWSMYGSAGLIPGSQPHKLVITLRHPDLKTLPKGD